MRTISLFLAAEAVRHARVSPSLEIMVPRSKRIWRKIGLAVLTLWLGLTLLILSVVEIAKRETLPGVDEPSPIYLPGSPFPEIGLCDLPHDGYLSCDAADDSLAWFGKKIYFIVDLRAGIIERMVAPTPPYTLGQLVASWGTPTGITQNGITTYIYWATRSVWLDTRSPRLDSPIQYIEYDLEPSQASPWRGFTR